MPTLTHYDIQFKASATSFPAASDDNPGPEVGEIQMIVWVKNPIGDPAPASPYAAFDLADTVEIDTESDAATTRTTLFYYGFNRAWTPNAVRYADVSAPFPALPTNVANFSYKTYQDVKQAYTSFVYFTV